MDTNNFEKASRAKLRYDTPKGLLMVEDLWDLPLSSHTGKVNLDDIARDLYKQLKDTEVVSFVNTDKKANENVQLAFDVVKHIIDVRLAENEVAAAKRANAEKKQQILGLIAQKETEQLSSKSIDELNALVASL